MTKDSHRLIIYVTVFTAVALLLAYAIAYKLSSTYSYFKELGIEKPLSENELDTKFGKPTQKIIDSTNNIEIGATYSWGKLYYTIGKKGIICHRVEVTSNELLLGPFYARICVGYPKNKLGRLLWLSQNGHEIAELANTEEKWGYIQSSDGELYNGEFVYFDLADGIVQKIVITNGL